MDQKQTQPASQKMKVVGSFLRSDKFRVLADQGLYSGTNFVVTIALARILDPRNFGLYSSIILIAYLLMGISNAFILQPFQVSGLKRQKSIAYSHFLFFGQLAFVLLLMALIGIAYLSVQALPRSLGAATFFMGTMLMHDFARKFYLAKNLLLKVLIIDSLVAVCQLTGLLLFFHNATLNTVLLLLAFSYLPPLIFFICDRRPVWRTCIYWGRFLQVHKREGSWLGLVSIIQWGSGNLFVASTGFFIGLQALGAFRLVQSLFGVLNILFQAFENYVLPAASRLHSMSVIESKNYIRKTGFQSGLLIGIMLLALFLCSDEVINLASAGKYAHDGYLVKGMCLLYFLVFMGYPVRLGIRLLLLNKSFFTGYLLSFVFSLLFFSTLLRHWQLNGVIAGLIANQLIMILFWTYQLNKQKFYLWK